jgi:hypothetical protein
MENNKEAWIKDALGSIDGIGRPQAPAGLQERIIAGLSTAKARRKVLRIPSVWLAAAGFLLLAGVNVYALVNHNKGLLTRKEHHRPGTNPLVEDYFKPDTIL